MVDVKICGLSDSETIAAAVDGGADYIGFVFYPPSPRNIAAGQAAQLAPAIPASVRKVGLVVDAKNDAIAAILGNVQLDMLQLHGGEPPERVSEIRARFGLPVIKALPIAGPDDLERVPPYEAVSDMLLFDAKPPKSKEGALPGGNGIAFDWNLIAGRSWRRPWMLSGGLNAENLEEAVRTSGAKTVDVSSGVEDAPGHKDAARIRTFLNTAKTL